MFKFVGSLAVMLGVVGCVINWNENRKRRIENIIELQKLIRTARFSLIREKRKVSEFFLYFSIDNTGQIGYLCKLVAMKLKEHTYPSGEAAWKSGVDELYQEFAFDKPLINILYQIGNEFFVRTSAQMNDSLNFYEARLEEVLDKEKIRLCEQKKLIMPLSAFGGILLIIILV